MSESTVNNDMKAMEQLVAAMLEPLRGQPLRLFVRSFTGYKMLPAPSDATWLDPLKCALTEAGQEINRKGLYSVRPNEVGNKIESFVMNALKNHGFLAGVPKTRNGREQKAGYPDIEVNGLKGQPEPQFYLECKTYNPKTVNSTQRTFYLSPPLAKVTKDAIHLLVAYRMEIGKENERQNGKNRYYAKEWKLIDLYDLVVDVKHEVQASNRELYKHNPILTGIIQ
ncbi:hypothetical protein D6779_03740 [Candidatus Parcubacteria bacterium]|nr:MAG: hypothetical protein D6779_03740 [Candidatus Parcubacteria bacterium]